jgi:hypothetical protein
MSIELIKHGVRGLLAQTNLNILHAGQALLGADALDRIQAEGRMVQLATRKAELEGRLRELNLTSDSLAETFVQWVKEDWRLVKLYFSELIQTE